MELWVKLFNLVLDTGNIPQSWLTGIIVPIYKNKGDVNDPNSFRGITLLSCVGKLLTSVLNNRLSNFVEAYDVISENQAGFCKNHSTVDHILQ